MTRIYPEQLAAQLREGLRGCYLLFGNDPLLLQESQDHICRTAQQQDFHEQFRFTLDNSTDWDAIFGACQALSLFSSRQILSLTLPDAGPGAPIGEQLVKLAGLLHPDVLLILRGAKLTRAQENSAWFKALSQKSIYVPCMTPEQEQLPRWVMQRAKNMKLELDEPACQLLCYCYEGNLLALSQALERLSLLYPDGKLPLPRVELAVSDAAHFSPFHWLDALLAGKSKRAWHILHQLRLEECEPVILLRTVQRELLLLLQLKRQRVATPLRTLFDQHKIWQNRRPLITQALQRLSLEQLQQAITLLARLEITLKQNYGRPIWAELETLAMILCGKALPDSLIEVY
ncbi:MULTISPECIES: DNA polymerase III subunit delta [Lonsdalea]|uniref:DNA polymerase III subunit delta n=2 Tax=Lonsdalea TaxID=1082702 RepID=A0ACD1JEL0_9GAMM|nr:MULTISPECIES: DNA polymerase III subunit delta [Lonsdalea]RAT15358.1 DNA polymerase III subunit delta [Lonsdalea quercina]RAT19807.1 DNA polymerase III subunit delta [Lonsdalea populi]RAT22461.1 DNA polymerase III subunit delta [Lonsdalea populi]RAT28891.1 DNA polymerase III subunit delta [Lonsdalea populi]RAT35891.1 DNA polymerase III subunit delta [Lonsdalea populi]